MADQPTTIRNFGPVLDEIRAILRRIEASQVTTNRFNQIVTHVDAQTVHIQANTDLLSALKDDVDNFTNLFEDLVQAVTGGATEALQLQEIALLEEIVPPAHAETGSFNPERAIITGP